MARKCGNDAIRSTVSPRLGLYSPQWESRKSLNATHPFSSCLRSPTSLLLLSAESLTVAAARMIPNPQILLLVHLYYACQIAALPTNATTPVNDPISPKTPDSDVGLFGNVYARYFLHALAAVLIAFLVRFIYQYVKIHYFPSMPTVSNGWSHYLFYMVDALVAHDVKLSVLVCAHLLTRPFSVLLVQTSSASGIGSTLSLGNLEGSLGGSLNLDAGSAQVRLPSPARLHQVHRPGRHDEANRVNHGSSVIQR